jgi:hypothetical protein
MKYLKLFENYNSIEIGEYVICKNLIYPTHDDNGIMNNFIHSTIGQITLIMDRDYKQYQVKYSNLPEEFYYRNDFYNITNPHEEGVLFVDVDLKDIDHHSKDKSELELILSSQEFNL